MDFIYFHEKSFVVNSKVAAIQLHLAIFNNSYMRIV